jgi:hypothetical protein
MKSHKKSLVRVSLQLHRIWTEAAQREEISRAAFLRLSLKERAKRVLADAREDERAQRERN